MPNSVRTPEQETDAVLTAGVEIWNYAVRILTDRGIDLSFGTSALGVAAAAAMTAEDLTAEQFGTVLAQTLRLWRRGRLSRGAVLVLMHPTLGQMVLQDLVEGN